MTAYTKTMAQALQEVYIEENNMAKMKKAASGSMQTLKMKDGNLQMDKVTASAIMAVYNAVNPKNKKTMENMLSTGKKSDIMKLQKFALSKTKMTNASYNMEEFEEVQEAMVNTNSVSMLDLMDLFDKAMSAKPGSDEQAKWKGQIRKLKKSMGVKEEVDLDEIDMNMVAFATFGFGAMVVLPGIIALDMLNSHTDGGVDRTLEKIINGLKSKLKKDKNYKPSSTEIDASKKLEKQIKKDEPSLYKKAMAKVKSISSKIKKEDLDEKLDKDDETIVKKVVDKLKKASQAHAGQSKDLQKAIDEDGHTDVASAQNNVKVAMSALTKMSGELSKLNPEDALPSWWTNKVAVAVDKLDGMADYLDTQVEELDLDEASKEGTVKIIKTKDGKFQIQKMTKGKFVNIGKPYNSQKEAEKFRSGQPDLFGEDYVLTVKDKEVNRYKSEKDARKAFHDLVKQHGHRNVKVFKEEADLDEASARGDAKRSMSRDRDFGRKDDLDKDDAASDDDVKAASKNIMMQLRKAANLRGTFAVEFGDKKKVKVDPKVAQAAASKYNSLRRPADKEKFQSQIAKSYKDMLKAIKEAVSPAQQAAIAISKKERGEKPKKESKFSTINKQLKGEK